jgi:hypothetical protein
VNGDFACSNLHGQVLEPLTLAVQTFHYKLYISCVYCCVRHLLCLSNSLLFKISKKEMILDFLIVRNVVVISE